MPQSLAKSPMKEMLVYIELNLEKEEKISFDILV